MKKEVVTIEEGIWDIEQKMPLRRAVLTYDGKQITRNLFILGDSEKRNKKIDVIDHLQVNLSDINEMSVTKLARHLKSIVSDCFVRNVNAEFELIFKSGDVTLANYFLDKDNEYLFDVPKEEQYSDKYTLQTLRGRFNRQDYIAKTHNTGYAQMGNMSADVYVSKDKKTIIIGDEPYWEEEKESASNKKFNKEFEANYKKVGSICMSVWRWECADKTELNKHKGYKAYEGVDVKVKPGTYVVKHFFGAVPRARGRYNVYSEIKMK